MVHEVPNPFLFFKEIRSILPLSGKFLLSEPILHVNQAMFEKTVKTAESCGLILMEKPKISLSRLHCFMAIERIGFRSSFHILLLFSVLLTKRLNHDVRKLFYL